MESERLQLYKSLVSEITKGMEQVKQVKVSPSNHEQEGVLERMMSSHEEALSILTGRAPRGQCQSVVSSLSDPPGSSTSEAASSGLLKRKTRTDIWNVKMKATGASLEEVTDDGYSWRKYGQKVVLGTKYPRRYYRCSNCITQGCLAKKQLHRLDDDPTTIDVTYQGRHTC